MQASCGLGNRGGSHNPHVDPETFQKGLPESSRVLHESLLRAPASFSGFQSLRKPHGFTVQAHGSKIELHYATSTIMSRKERGAALFRKIRRRNR